MVNENKTLYTVSQLENFDFEISRDEIFINLSNDFCHDFLKIFSILNIKNILSESEAELFIKHLTNHPNPIREAVAFKLEDVVFSNKYFRSDFSINQMLNGIVDINPNVSRAICNILQKENELAQKLEKPIVDKLLALISEIKVFEKDHNDSFDDKLKNRKYHAKNKKLFSLYWLLEALSCCLSQKYNSQVLEVVKYTINFTDYTIREKSAKILAIIKDAPFELLQKAKDDQNFYVKNQVYDKINFEIDKRN